MWVILALVIGSVLMVVSGFTWVARRDALEQARRIEALTLVALDGTAEQKLSAVRGKASSDEPLTDPVTGERVVFYEASVERVDRGNEEVASARGGRVVTLEDGRGRGEVELDGAELDVEHEQVEEADRTPSAAMRAVFEAASVETPEEEADARYALVHRAIAEGEELTVIGVPRLVSAATAPRAYRGGLPGVPRFSADAGPLIVTERELPAIQERERRDARSMTVMIRLAMLVGAVLLGLAGLMMVQAAG